eukprot:scaffold69552_cov53-Phaeocystis_antarctica.AAC.1
MRPEVGTYRAIQAVLDQVENPASFPGNREAWEWHGAGRGTFKKWKKILSTSWQRWKEMLHTAGHLSVRNPHAGAEQHEGARGLACPAHPVAAKDCAAQTESTAACPHCGKDATAPPPPPTTPHAADADAPPPQ